MDSKDKGAPPPYSEVADHKYAIPSQQGQAPSYNPSYHPQQGQVPYNPYPYNQPGEYTHVNMMHANYGATIVDQPVTVPVTQVILIGGCPSCRVGVLEDSFSFLGILCAILFFPVGILCCLALKDKRCSNCNASF